VKQRQILTKYRLSDHNLAVETGRHRKTWLRREHRMCDHCQAEKVETEEHFLLHCKKCEILRRIYMEHKDKIAILFGEGPSAALAAQYVLKCYNLRDSI
jgi:hypothetical protein